MPSNPNKNPPDESPSLILFLLYFLFPFFSTVIFFLLAGTIHFISGWIFNIIYVLLFFSIPIRLWKNDSGLLKERNNPTGYENQKMWNKFFVSLLMVLYIVWFFIMPLDAVRYGWTGDVSFVVLLAGFLLFLLSSFFLYSSVKQNSFLSSELRIQEERGQKVISTGVYGIIRHPMYFGNITLFIGVPVFLGSGVGLIIGIVLSVLLIFRIPVEEKMLKEDLDGYLEYMEKVKYRLIPFIW